MSAKVNYGISWIGTVPSVPVYDDFLLLRPDSGGWLLNKELEFLYEVLSHLDKGWGWGGDYDRQYGGAALVAPLTILYWEKDDV